MGDIQGPGRESQFRRSPFTGHCELKLDENCRTLLRGSGFFELGDRLEQMFSAGITEQSLGQLRCNLLRIQNC